MKLRNIKFFLANLLLRKELRLAADDWAREPSEVALSPVALDELAATEHHREVSEKEIAYLKTKLTVETTLRTYFHAANKSSNQQLLALWAAAYDKLTPEERSKFDLGLPERPLTLPPELATPRYEPYHDPD